MSLLHPRGVQSVDMQYEESLVVGAVRQFLRVNCAKRLWGLVHFDIGQLVTSPLPRTGSQLALRMRLAPSASLLLPPPPREKSGDTTSQLINYRLIFIPQACRPLGFYHLLKRGTMTRSPLEDSSDTINTSFSYQSCHCRKPN